MVPAVSTITGITSVFTFHMSCIATVRLLLLLLLVVVVVVVVVVAAALVLLSIVALLSGPG